jgi:thiol-disulfide isomerase/thioredoxin
MLRTLIAAAAALALAGPVAGRPFAEAVRLVEPPAEAPAGATVSAEGVEGPLSEHLDGVTVLVLWAEWCPVCRDELPKIAAAARRAGATLTPLSVDTRPDAPARAAAFLAAHGVESAPPLFDRDLAAAKALGVTGIPHVALIDAAGRVTGRVTGRMDWEDPAFDAYVSALARGD